MALPMQNTATPPVSPVTPVTPLKSPVAVATSAVPTPTVPTQSQPVASSSPIPEGPQIQGYSLKPATLQSWLQNGASPQEAHTAAMAVDPTYAAGTKRMEAYATAHGQPSGNDPVFIARMFKVAFGIGQTPKPNADMGALMGALQKMQTPEPAATPAPVASPAQSPLGDIGNDFFQMGKSALNDVTGGFQSAIDQAKHVSNPQDNALEMGAKNLLPTMGAMAGGLADAISEPVKPIMTGLWNLALQDPTIDKAKVQQGIAMLGHSISQLQEAHPEIARQIEGALKTVSLPLAMQGAEGAVKTGGDIVEGIGKGVMDNGGKVAGDIAQGVTEMAQTPAAPTSFSPQTKMLADYYGVNPEELTSVISKSGVANGSDSEVEAALSKAFGKDSSGFMNYVDEKLGDNATAADYNAAEKARMDSVQSLPAHAVQPKMSAADLKKMAATPAGAKLMQEGADSTGMIKNSMGPALSNSENDLHVLARSIPGYGEGEGAVSPDKIMSPDAALHNTNVVGNQIVNESNQLDSALEKNNFLIPKEESTSAVSKALDEAANVAPEEAKAYSSAKNIWERIRGQFDGNATGERAARKEFDAYVTDRWGPKIFDKGTPQADAIRAVRTASTDLIQKYASKNGLNYTGQLKRLSGMYDLMDNLATHVTPDVFKSTVSRIISKPLVKMGAKGLGLATGMEVLPHILP